MEISQILNSLNPVQLEAVSSEHSHILVLAGAGSGKTRVLTHRIAWLLQSKQISPRSIIAVTFTNKAANEMKNRVETLTSVPAKSMWIGTFHSIALRLLRLHHQELNLPETFQVIDSEDQHRLIRRIIRNFNLDEEKWPPKQAQWYINNKKDEGIRSKYITTFNKPSDDILSQIYTEYEKLCEQNGLVDFAELLLRAHELFLKNTHVLQHYQQRFQHILVDEFQDINTIQYAWIRLLAGGENHLMIVGDDDQSIYSWRGAKVENLHHFQKDFPKTFTTRLEQNYRSTNTILKAANAVIANNMGRMGKNLWTSEGKGDAISVYEAFNENDEAHFIAKSIIDWVNTGNNYNECAILYRSNAQSRVIEEYLLRMNIPYKVYGGLRFFERAEIKDALAYLHLLENKNNDAAFERIVNTPSRGIGLQTISTIRKHAKTQNESMWQAAQNLSKDPASPSRTTNALIGFISLIEQLKKDIKDIPLHEQISQVLHSSTLLHYYQNEKSEKKQMRLENLEELVNSARQFELDDHEDLSPLTTFLSYATLETGEHQTEDTNNCVQLMTLHSAKGLEFKTVFLAGCEEGLFPHQMSLEENLEEERRLCYVGITRAMQKLYLTHACERYLYGSKTTRKPSRFIHEIPLDCLHKLQIKSKIAAPITINKKYPPPSRNNTNPHLSHGKNVIHQKFGEGVILNVDGQGSKTRIHVHFKRHGPKWLIAELANLKYSS